MSKTTTKCKSESCGKPLKQIPGKRQKEYCNSTCRSNQFQKNKRAAEKQVEKIVSAEKEAKDIHAGKKKGVSLTKAAKSLDKKIVFKKATAKSKKGTIPSMLLVDELGKWEDPGVKGSPLKCVKKSPPAGLSKTEMLKWHRNNK
jgi:hypothetical protein